LRVEVFSRGEQVSASAEILGGSVTEKWVSGLRSTLALSVDPSPEWLGWFKLPGLEVRPHSGMGWGSTEHLEPLGVFPVLQPELSLPRDAVTVQADDQWQGVTLGDFGFPVPTIPGRIRDVIGVLVGAAQAPWAPPITITATSTAALAAGGLWDKSRSETVLTLTDSIGAEVFYARDGGLVIQDRATRVGTDLVDGDDGTVLTVKRIPGPDIYNVIAVSGSNNDAVFEPVVVGITDPYHPAHRSNLGYARVMKFSSPLLMNRDQAMQAGLTLLGKHSAAASSWAVTCIPDATRQAGDLLTLTTQEFGSVLCTVQEVTHPLGEGPQTLVLGAA
jgi:hypothetical protein